MYTIRYLDYNFNRNRYRFKVYYAHNGGFFSQEFVYKGLVDVYYKKRNYINLKVI